MNQSEKCHRIDGCPGLYIDAFRSTFRSKHKNPSNAFILTHYHGDHYSGLPRDGRYDGPAMIHCTPVTGALLRDVHGVSERFICEHDYGETWSYRYDGSSGSGGSCGGDDNDEDGKQQRETQPQQETNTTTKTNEVEEGLRQSSQSSHVAQVTFYDANHCPGAAIVFISLGDDDNNNKTTPVCHLHTGDFRYHEKMTKYPLIKKAVEERTLDLVYLDTTYGHPKHDFLSQEDAVNKVASQVKEILKPSGGTTTTTTTKAALVLLSCYSIGKEKILWESSHQSQQRVYIDSKKMKKLQCCYNGPKSSAIIEQRTTTDPNASDLHVIPMGLAGEMHPYFRPNYDACVSYASTLEKEYDKIVAFVPTGWANASNWNKKHAVNRRRQQVVVDDETDDNNKTKNHHIDVEIHLVPYSEHSSFDELYEFVSFLKPRKVIPTVFSSDAEYMTIEKRFRGLVDMKRAKLNFMSLMLKSTKSSSNINNGSGSSDTTKIKADEPGDCDTTTTTTTRPHDSKKITTAKEVVVVSNSNDDDNVLSTLISMGFDETNSREALLKAGNGNLDKALDCLLLINAQQRPMTTTTTTTTAANNVTSSSTSSSSSSKIATAASLIATKKSDKEKKRPSTTQSRASTITSYFSRSDGKRSKNR